MVRPAPEEGRRRSAASCSTCRKRSLPERAAEVQTFEEPLEAALAVARAAHRLVLASVGWERQTEDLRRARLDAVCPLRRLQQKHPLGRVQVPLQREAGGQGGLAGRGGLGLAGHRRRQRPRAELVPFRQRRRALHHVLELPHVPRERVPRQRRQRLLGEAQARALQLLAHPIQELPGQHADVLGALAQGRQLKGDDVEPVEQVWQFLSPHRFLRSDASLASRSVHRNQPGGPGAEPAGDGGLWGPDGCRRPHLARGY
jgi:hypothetical protein